MYFVQQGECNVIIKDKVGLNQGKKQVRKLFVGDYFGEVSLIYKCRRSAYVTANNYCTLAALDKDNFKEIVNKFPLFLTEMKEQIFAYDDEVKIFLLKHLKKIPYLKTADEDVLNEVLYNIRQETFDKGSYIFKKKEKSNAMFIVKNGILEITCPIEN